MRRTRATRACALALVALVAPACGGGSADEEGSTTTTTTASSATGAGSPAPPATEAVRVIELAVAGGQVAGGVRKETVAVGERVRLRVTSDVPDEVHVHTYDVRVAARPGVPAEVELTATIPGRHEVELEEAGKPLLVLEVR